MYKQAYLEMEKQYPVIYWNMYNLSSGCSSEFQQFHFVSVNTKLLQGRTCCNKGGGWWCWAPI